MSTSVNGLKGKFHGDLVDRVFVVFPENSCIDFTRGDFNFITHKFNSLRNFRTFFYNHKVEVIEVRDGKFPNISTLREGDACLLLGSGRVIDKREFNFAKKCFEHDIPVFFIRTNSLYCDPRLSDPIWKTTTLIVQVGDKNRIFMAPDKYFMEIPTLNDLIQINQHSDDFYAMLPGMVPV